ncbi:hypothetical protein SRHO_G00256600 [Serrasalmus rhombeus]
MQSCSSAHCVLILLIFTFTAVYVSAVPPVKVKLNETATLPCSERCSGLVRWTVFHKPRDALAECDQTSCRSVKEGYQMIYDQYLKGDLSLTITDTDFSKRTSYTCDCDGKDLCDVALKIETVNTLVQIRAGESLVLNLDISDPLEVIYNSRGTSGTFSRQICTVDGQSLECKPEYKDRMSLTSDLELREMKPSDSGVYTIRDIKTKEDIHVYAVIVQGAPQVSVPGWATALILLTVAVVILVLVLVFFMRSHNQSIKSTNEQTGRIEKILTDRLASLESTVEQNRVQIKSTEDTLKKRLDSLEKTGKQNSEQNSEQINRIEKTLKEKHASLERTVEQNRVQIKSTEDTLKKRLDSLEQTGKQNSEQINSIEQTLRDRLASLERTVVQIKSTEDTLKKRLDSLEMTGDPDQGENSTTKETPGSQN